MDNIVSISKDYLDEESTDLGISISLTSHQRSIEIISGRINSLSSFNRTIGILPFRHVKPSSETKSFTMFLRS